LGILAYGSRAEEDAALVALVYRLFQLGQLKQTRDLGGAYNLNLLLTTSTGRYVMRTYRPWVLDERLVFLQHVRSIIQRSGLPVPQLLSTTTGETFVRYADRLVEVESFVASDAVVNTWERCTLVCSLLGKLHSALASPEVTTLPIIPPAHSNSGTPAILLKWTQQSVGQIRAQSSTSPARDVQRALDLCAITGELLSSLQTWWEHTGQAVPQQLTHGDYKGDNMLLRQGQVVALLDLDFLGMRERIFDLAYLLYWMLLCFEDLQHPAQLPWSRAATMLIHYDAAAYPPLTDEERCALPLEIARVPLYWVGEAHLLPDPVSAVVKLTVPVQFSRWVLTHRDELADLFRKKP
jgi:Ser/Thr protein kinase RdoA (MazF antagonist)